MAATKLILSAEKSLIRDTKRIAAERHTSVSAMFARFLRLQTHPVADKESVLAPITRKALGIVRLPKRKADRKLIEEALSEKYERGK